MSKKFFGLIIIGAIFLSSGFAILINFTNIVEERYPDVEMFFDGNLKQTELSSTSIDLLEENAITITILSPENQMFFSLRGPNGSTLEEAVFFETLSHSIIAKTNGTYTIDIGNMDSHTAQVMGLISEQPINVEEFILSNSVSIIAASFLILVGMVLVIVIVLLIVLKKFRANSDLKKIKK